MCTAIPCSVESVALRLRINGASTGIIDMDVLGTKDERSYFADAARKIVREIDPFTVAAYYYREANYDEAAKIAHELIRKHHKDREWARNLLAAIALKNEDLSGARTILLEAIHDEDDFYLVHNNLGHVLEKMGEDRDAIAEFRRAIELKDDYSMAHFELGYVLEEGRG